VRLVAYLKRELEAFLLSATKATLIVTKHYKLLTSVTCCTDSG